MNRSVEGHYHSYLEELKSLDPIINKMRGQVNTPWRKNAWIGPLKQIVGHSRNLRFAKAIQWGSLPIIGPLFGLFTTVSYTSWPFWIILCSAVVFSGLAYLGCVKVFEGKMANMGDSQFHVEAFKVKRPSEYLLWATFINKPGFTFGGLYDTYQTIVGSSSSYDNLVAFTQGQHEFLQSTIQELQSSNDKYKAANRLLQREIEQIEKTVFYLIGILKQVNTNLYRFTNGKLKLSDLDFISGYSIYRIEGEYLEKFYDKGTSGSDFGPFNLRSDAHKGIAVVDAANSEGDLQAFHDEPYPGRQVVAFKMKMQGGLTWVWSFHFDDDDDRALSLVLLDGIIELRQIRRLIHAFCLVLNDRRVEEAGQGAKAR